MALFTVETARQAGITSAQRKAERKAQAALLPVNPPLPTIETTETIRTIELSRVRLRLDALDKLMSEAETDRQWDNLSRAYERVFRAWVHLAGIPGPGQRKPLPEAPRRKVYTDAGPTAIANTTTPSVPVHPEVISNPKPLTDNESH